MIISQIIHGYHFVFYCYQIKRHHSYGTIILLVLNEGGRCQYTVNRAKNDDNKMLLTVTYSIGTNGRANERMKMENG